jgi:hypothetical protein
VRQRKITLDYQFINSTPVKSKCYFLFQVKAQFFFYEGANTEEAVFLSRLLSAMAGT